MEPIAKPEDSQTTGTGVDADREEVLQAQASGVTLVQEAIGAAISSGVLMVKDGKFVIVDGDKAIKEIGDIATGIGDAASQKAEELITSGANPGFSIRANTPGLTGTIVASTIDWARKSKVEIIAKTAHEVNAAYCRALGDNSQTSWEDAPQWQKDSAYMGVELHLSGDYGPEKSHESWMAQKVAEGWVYGEKKDPEAKTHHCIRPFNELPLEQQVKDHLFRGVVHSLRKSLSI